MVSYIKFQLIHGVAKKPLSASPERQEIEKTCLQSYPDLGVLVLELTIVVIKGVDRFDVSILAIGIRFAQERGGRYAKQIVILRR